VLNANEKPICVGKLSAGHVQMCCSPLLVPELFKAVGAEQKIQPEQHLKAAELRPGERALPQPQESQGPSPYGSYLRVLLWLWEEQFTLPYCAHLVGMSGCAGFGCQE